MNKENNKILITFKNNKSKKMSTINFKKIPIITILLTSFAIVSGGISSLIFENSFAHNFSPDESAHFLTIVDKIKVETQLAANNTGSDNNNQSSAQLHVNNAILNYDSNTKSEISEKNKRIANELDDTLNQLLVEIKSQMDKSQLDNTVETINAILEEAITTRIDEEQLNNSTIQALVLANIVDAALQKYGDAFNVGIDLTNMSNLNRSMVQNDTKTQDHNNHSSSNDTVNQQQMSIVNFSSYESVLGFSNNALDKYYNEISTISPPLSENNTTTGQNYLKKLENGLVELNNAIKNKENAMKVMEIVHTQIHPNLQILFNLKLK
ncbi:MAG TPA: hypothetical protein VHJ38_07730 [Nitrososphaeraceae archaeon]|jgi:hypothetical protein|nr:hypothetical protein [Nitrososphaeraceae archaeon]